MPAPGKFASPAAHRARANAARIEAAGLVLLWLAALAIRLPYLWSAPPTPDELRETGHALAASLHVAWLTPDPAAPLVGPVHDVMLGVAFGLVGPSPELPRLVVAVLAAGTVPLVYVLARELARPVGRRRLEDGFVGPRLAGLAAAGLVATSSAHVVVASQAALAHNLAPFFVVAALFALERAFGTRDGRWLIPSGALLGLALQTHPSMAALLLGAGLALWRTGRSLVLSGWGVAGLAALGLAYAPVLVAVLGGGPIATMGVGAAPRPELGAPALPATYGQTLSLASVALWQLLASRLADPPPTDRVLLDPLAWPYVGLAGLGLLILVLRGRPLLPFAGLGFLLVLPLFAAPEGMVAWARALMPVVLIGSAAAGVTIGTFAPLVARRGSLARLALLIALLLFVLGQLADLWAYRAGGWG